VSCRFRGLAAVSRDLFLTVLKKHWVDQSAERLRSVLASDGAQEFSIQQTQLGKQYPVQRVSSSSAVNN
jgi:hypothetical protein